MWVFEGCHSSPGPSVTRGSFFSEPSQRHKTCPTQIFLFCEFHSDSIEMCPGTMSSRVTWYHLALDWHVYLFLSPYSWSPARARLSCQVEGMCPKCKRRDPILPHPQRLSDKPSFGLGCRELPSTDYLFSSEIQKKIWIPTQSVGKKFRFRNLWSFKSYV